MTNPPCFSCNARKGTRFVRGNRIACRKCVPDIIPPCRDCGAPNGTHRGGGLRLCNGCFAKRPKCAHCLTRVARRRPVGLCYHCIRDTAVRALLGIESGPTVRRGVGIAPPRRLPPAPTTAAPGTPEKMAVMEARAEAETAIFHPADARWEGDTLPLHHLRRNR